MVCAGRIRVACLSLLLARTVGVAAAVPGVEAELWFQYTQALPITHVGNLDWMVFTVDPQQPERGIVPFDRKAGADLIQPPVCQLTATARPVQDTFSKHTVKIDDGLRFGSIPPLTPVGGFSDERPGVTGNTIEIEVAVPAEARRLTLYGLNRNVDCLVVAELDGQRVSALCDSGEAVHWIFALAFETARPGTVTFMVTPGTEVTDPSFPSGVHLSALTVASSPDRR